MTQSLVRSLLTESGMTAVPLGIEEVFRELSDLDPQRYLALGLPLSLRKLPDFLAVNKDRSQSWLIEVKFRKAWNDRTREELGATLTEQVNSWSPLTLVLFFGETPSQYPDNPSSWVRAATLTMQAGELHSAAKDGPKPWGAIRWTDLSRIQDVFPALNDPGKWEAEVVQATLMVSKSLIALS